MAKTAKERFKTLNDVFDLYTENNIFKLITQGHFDGLIGPVSTGKEANIFAAKKGDKKVIVKIYRLETCDFNRMYDYIKFDPRYAGLKKKKRKIIFAWCQREFRNLLKARAAGMRVPMPITFRDNLLVIEFIGSKDAAPKLKDAIPDNPKKFYDLVVEDMKRFYKAGLVHGDLSEFNILNHNEKPYIIDLSQASPLNSANAKDLIERDIKNIVRFFNKIGLKEDIDSLREKIMGKVKDYKN